MYSLLIVIIYLAFISLGLPDPLLGAAWPVMHQDLGTTMAFAGVISMTISAGTIVSSLLSDRLTRKFGAGLVTAVSVAMTAVALFGFSVSGSVIVLILWAIPYGLGAGAVDSALNNYVALHYTARHMSWLHCFWGVGTAISPYIMSFCLGHGLGWQSGYRSVSVLQVILTVILFISLPIWAKRDQEPAEGEDAPVALGILGTLRLPGALFVLIAFFGYSMLESTAGLWASSYLVEYRSIDPVIAAKYASLFYLGITFGRFLNGFIADKMGDRKMIRIGLGIAAIGLLLVMVSFIWSVLALIGLVITGLGCAPIYPSIIHSTPINFGRRNSQAIIGIQMAFAYVGSMLMPSLFGVIADHTTLGLYPFYLGIAVVLQFVMMEKLNRIVKQIKLHAD